MLRTILATVILAVLLYVGAVPVGPAPALGGFLDPAHGAWSAVRAADLPDDATADIRGLGGDVRVQYDARGVPHIFASSRRDAVRALGYVVARDRLFQLYLQTIAASGRLTEVAGARALPLDEEMRRLGLPRAAERRLAVLDPDTRGLLDAFADGVNAYIDGMRPEELPIEFRLIGRRPERWQPINSLHLMMRMGWTLAHISPEVEQAAASSRIGDRAAAQLFPANASIQEPIQPNGARGPRYDLPPTEPPGPPDTAALLVADVVNTLMPARAARFADAGDSRPYAASNNWAVSPRRSANGHALLAGDPHLELTLPSIWYEVHMVVPDTLDVYGVTIPGAPGPIIGFNRDVAWTFTNTGADVLDFYAETVDDSLRPTRYLLDGTWRPVEQRIERYRGKRGEVVATDTLRFTHRGPMTRRGSRWLSMRWTVLEPSNDVRGFLDAARATSAAALQDAFAASFFAPAQNLLAADRGGTIAIRSTGHFPVRPDDGNGLTVRDGSTSASDWKGYLPLSQYPQAMNPEQGYVASANQQPVDPLTSHAWFGGDYEAWRAMRINHLLRADSQVTVDRMREFQTDPGSERADLFAPFFLAAARSRAAAPPVGVDARVLADAMRVLAAWDRRYTRDNGQAVLFELAMHELSDRTWDELIGRDTAADGTPRRVATPSGELLATMLPDSSNTWWDDRRTRDRIEHRDDILAASLAAAMDTARARFGPPGSDDWRWSRRRHANINHLLRLPALSAREIPVQGGPGTLSPSSGMGLWGPSWRMVVDLGPDLRAWATYPGGQSGRPASPRYMDHLAAWRAGTLDSLRFPRRPEDLRGADAARRLRLTPGGAQ